MWPVVLSGLLMGGLYIAISLGVVLTFRFAHILNFAQGAIATLAAYAAWQAVDDGVSIWLGCLIAIGVGAGISLVLGTIVGRYLGDAGELVTAMATFGPALAVIGVVGELWGQNAKALPAPSLLSGTVSIAGATVGRFELAFLLSMLLLVGLISAGLRRTRTGLALRALADDPATAAVNGISVASLERMAWIGAGGIAGLAGVGISISAQLDPNYLTTFLISAFTAVVLGGIGTLAGLVVGCLLYGVLVAMVSYYVGSQFEALTALVLLTALYLVRPTGLLGHQTLVASNGLPTQSDSVGGRWIGALLKVSTATDRLRPRTKAGRRTSVVTVLVAAGLATVVLPLIWSGSLVFVLATAIAMIIAVSGQNVASGLSGRLAVAQGGFMMLGGYCAGLLVSRAGASPIVALLASVVVGAVLGSALGLSIIRLSGIYLGIITLQFTLVVPELAKAWTGLTGGELGIVLPPLQVGGWLAIAPYDVWIVSVIVALAVLGLLAWFSYSRWGVRIRAARDSEPGAESIGLDVRWLRVGAVVVSGAAGSLAGALGSFQSGIITPESFGMWTSVTVLLAAAIAGQNSVVIGPLVGGAFVVLLPYGLSASGGWSSIIFGLVALAILILRRVVARGRMLAGSKPVREESPADVRHASLVP